MYHFQEEYNGEGYVWAGGLGGLQEPQCGTRSSGEDRAEGWRPWRGLEALGQSGLCLQQEFLCPAIENTGDPGERPPKAGRTACILAAASLDTWRSGPGTPGLRHSPCKVEALVFTNLQTR